MAVHAPLIIDIAGTALNAVDRQRLRHPLVGGLILFSRNWESRLQLTALCNSIKRVRADLLICVDHEGGRVQRFKTDGFTHVPPMRALGEMWLSQPQAGRMAGPLDAMRAATACGYVLGAELRACGVDFSFAPVLDLDYGESSVIGDRAFARDPRVVSMLAQSVIHGLLQSGMGSCGKHFPGHGFVKADSHLAIPVDRRSLKSMLAEDAAPYRWLGGVLGGVMPAHVIYPKVDSRPAGFSRVWLQDVLRAKLGFDGAVFSDDLSMAAARVIEGRALSYTDAALAALNAGCDMVLLCNQSVLQPGRRGPIDDLIAGIAQAHGEGRWVMDERSEARRQALFPKIPGLGWDSLQRSSAYTQSQHCLP